MDRTLAAGDVNAETAFLNTKWETKQAEQEARWGLDAQKADATQRWRACAEGELEECSVAEDALIAEGQDWRDELDTIAAALKSGAITAAEAFDRKDRVQRGLGNVSERRDQLFAREDRARRMHADPVGYDDYIRSKYNMLRSFGF